MFDRCDPAHDDESVGVFDRRAPCAAGHATLELAVQILAIVGFLTVLPWAFGLAWWLVRLAVTLGRSWAVVPVAVVALVALACRLRAQWAA